jgi:hypothetical protein
LFLSFHHLWAVYPIVINNNITSNAGSIQSKLAIVNEVIFRHYNFKSSKPIIFELVGLKLYCLNIASFTIASLDWMEPALEVILLLMTIGYTAHKWWKLKNK